MSARESGVPPLAVLLDDPAVGLASCFFFYSCLDHRDLHSFPTRRSSDLTLEKFCFKMSAIAVRRIQSGIACSDRSEDHTSELQSHSDLVCRLLLEKKNQGKQRS